MRKMEEARILIVDDNHELLDLLRSALSNAGYHSVSTAVTATATRKRLQADTPDLIVLDINLPDGDGFSLFQEIREKSEVPILFLSARDADRDRLYGLGLGADDYLTKPFLMQELILRMQSILRRFYRSALRQTALFSLGGVQINLQDAQVRRQEKTVSLTAMELALLRKLYENRGHIVTFDALCETAWGDGYFGYENALNVHIRHLREKIEETPSHPRWLLTVRGLGYKLREEDTP